ncbi:hypothetical protein D2Q93_07745 [Alicyclobacillaceae bacterium I2511]|nr:hypothetical protein D2Q93_07745 [Alicyclobacillaceae bacterium I2511]
MVQWSQSLVSVSSCFSKGVHAGRTAYRRVEVNLVEFPELKEHWMSHPEDGSGREWLLSVAKYTEDYFQTGGRVGPWMKKFQSIRHHIVENAWQMAMAGLPVEDGACINLVAFGSTARAEDLLYSDLDHGVLFCSTRPAQNPVWQTAITQALRKFSRNLLEFGFPPCHGYVMALNDRWFGTSEQWRGRIKHYTSFPDWEQTRYLLIMLDGRSVLQPADSEWAVLWEQVASTVRASAFLQWEAAHLGIAATAPSRLADLPWVGRPKAGDVLNVKERILSPLIDSLRLWSVTEGCTDISSQDRIKFLREHQIMQPSLLDSIEVALQDGWRLRLIHQATCLQAGRDPEQLLRWGELSELDQAVVLRHLGTVQELVRQGKRKFRKPRS